MLFEKLGDDVVPFFHCEHLEIEFDGGIIDVYDDEIVGPVARATERRSGKEIWVSLEDIPELFHTQLSALDIAKYYAIMESYSATMN